ncbi:Ketimine reductase mu-crystallin, partial [Lamellibrachia satsuma]
MSGVPRIIAAPDVYKLLSPKDLLPVIEKALGNYSMGHDGGVIQPVRTVVPIDKYHGFLGVMSAYSGRDEALAVKLVSVYPEAKTGVTHQAWVMMFNPLNGNLTA